jgi:hypothetical protein
MSSQMTGEAALSHCADVRVRTTRVAISVPVVHKKAFSLDDSRNCSSSLTAASKKCIKFNSRRVIEILLLVGCLWDSVFRR